MSGQMEEVVELLVTKESPAIGKSIGHLRLPADTTIALLMREGERPRIPNTDTVLKENDRIIALTTIESEKVLDKMIIG
jgi:Trk K+ transport system NAD-binding subunit